MPPITITPGLTAITLTDACIDRARLPEALTQAGLLRRCGPKSAGGGVNPYIAELILADLRTPDWRVTGDDLRALYEDEFALKPTAVLVSAAAFDLFRDHAWEMAQRGIMHAVFLRLQSALQWCHVRMELAQLAQAPAALHQQQRALSGR